MKNTTADLISSIKMAIDTLQHHEGTHEFNLHIDNDVLQAVETGLTDMADAIDFEIIINGAPE